MWYNVKNKYCMDNIVERITDIIKNNSPELAAEEILDLFDVSKSLPNDFGKPPKTDAEWDVMCNRITNENK